MTPRYTFQGEPQALDRPVTGDGLHGILAACRRKAARRGQHGRDARLIKPYGEDEKSLHNFTVGQAMWVTDYNDE